MKLLGYRLLLVVALLVTGACSGSDTVTPVNEPVDIDQIGATQDIHLSDTEQTDVDPKQDAADSVMDTAPVMDIAPVMDTAPVMDCTDEPDGTLCDDGDPCTISDSCENGVCKSGPEDEDCLEEADSDSDGILDEQDNCPAVANAEQEDLDEDGEGDACDLDIDGDDSLNEDDCEPTNKDIHPAADETCNSLDDNCDNETDEGLAQTCEAKNDFGSCEGISTCFEGEWQPCNAATPEAELCDGKDNNCDGTLDEGFPDTDGDDEPDCLDKDDDNDGIIDPYDNCPKVANPNQEDMDVDQIGDACDPDIDGDSAVNIDDCEPMNAIVYPGADETCNNQDDDCDGKVDDSLSKPCTVKNDFGTCDGIESCTEGNWLCDASTPTKEICDGADNDCDEQVDEGSPDTDDDDIADCVDDDDDNDGVLDDDDNCPLVANPPPAPGFPQTDLDNDLLGDVCDPDIDGDGVCNDVFPIPGMCTGGPDCKPVDAAVYPGAPEQCDGKDTNCDGNVDNLAFEACSVTNDFGSCEGVMACVSGAATCVGDEAKQELCNGVDEDCDGKADNGFPDTDSDGQANCVDNDDDGDGEDDQTDCQPLDKTVSHLAIEICNEIDDNCNGAIDEKDAVGCKPWYLDVDNDGYGVVEFSQCLCGPKDLYVATQAGDCEPLNPLIHPKAEELCNGLDDDCDKIVDGFDSPCSSACGDGWQTCTAGVYGDCSAQQPKSCMDYSVCETTALCAENCPAAPAEICNGLDDNCNDTIDETYTCIPGTKDTAECGSCGTQSRVCTAQCAWGDYGECVAGGQCVPGEKTVGGPCGNCGSETLVCGENCQWEVSGCTAEGACQTDTVDSQPCGNCGDQTRTCQANCQWGDFGECKAQGECSPDNQETLACGDQCGSQTRTCDASCKWGDFGSCNASGSCNPGDQEEQACGNCGKQIRTCGQNCEWGGFGSCLGQGQCKPGDSENADCGNCGSAERTCSNSCQWSPFGPCSGQGVCAPGDKSNLGCLPCQTRSCTGNCILPEVCTECAGCNTFKKCGVNLTDPCGSTHHPTAFSKTASCGQSFTDNQTTCKPNCGNSFKKCLIPDCPEGYHSTAFSKTASCGSAFSDNQATCVINSGVFFKKCGIDGCPAGYISTAYSKTASCGSTFGNNQTTCTKF